MSSRGSPKKPHVEVPERKKESQSSGRKEFCTNWEANTRYYIDLHKPSLLSYTTPASHVGWYPDSEKLLLPNYKIEPADTFLQS